MNTNAATALYRVNHLGEEKNTLWQSYKQGDVEALKNIYVEYFDLLCLYGRQFATDDPCLVEDCIQELFIRLFSKHNKSTLSDTTSIKYYLMKSLRRAILNAKKLSYRKRTNLMGEINDFDLTGIKMMDYEFEEMKNAQMKKYLKKLPVRQQEAIYMRFIAELEFQEIAVKMNLTIKSVYKVIYKGLNNLRQMYDTAVA